MLHPAQVYLHPWLDAHPEVETFAIVDDNADMRHLEPYLVRTYWDHWKDYTSGPLGFSESTISSLVDLLGLEEPELSDRAEELLDKHKGSSNSERMAMVMYGALHVPDPSRVFMLINP